MSENVPEETQLIIGRCRFLSVSTSIIPASPQGKHLQQHKRAWPWEKGFLSYQIRKSEVSAWARNSSLTHVILPIDSVKKEICHVNSVCIGCIARHVTLLLS